MCPTIDALEEGVRTIPGVDLIETDGEYVTFTVFWGGVGDEGYRATGEGIENFTRQYGVGVETVSGVADETTWRVVPDGEPFEFDARDVYDISE